MILAWVLPPAAIIYQLDRYHDIKLIMELPNLLLLFTSLVNTLIAIFVVYKNPKDKINLSFGILSFGLALWAFTNLGFNISDSYFAVYYWGLASYPTVVIVGGALTYFSHLFPRNTGAISTNRFRLLVCLVVLISILSAWPGVLLQDVARNPSGHWQIVTTGLLPVYGITVVLLILGGIVRLVRKYRSVGGVARLQLGYLFSGMLLTTIPGVVTNLLLPLLDNYDFVWLGPNFTIILASITAYSIIKYRFMDIRFAVRAMLVRLIGWVAIGGLATLAALLFINDIVVNTTRNIVIITLGASFAFVIIYEPLLTLIRRVTDSFLFQKEYSHQELVKNLSKVVAQSLDLDEILSNIKSTLIEVMRVEYVGFVLWAHTELDGQEHGESGQHRTFEVWGFDEAEIPYKWDIGDKLIEHVEKHTNLIIFDELVREVSEMEGVSKLDNKEQLVEEMRAINAGVIMPLLASEGVTGFAVLGEKKGEDAFSSGDISTLETLMFQSGVAIENASLFSEIQQFNIKLRKEVARATEDLALKNQSLTILRHLDQVIISSRGIKEMSQKIVDTISWELGHRGGLMVLLEKSKNQLHAVAFSNTPIYKKISSLLPLKLTDYVLPLNKDESNYLIRAVKERKPFYTSDFKDLYVPAIPADLAEKIQVALGAHHNLVYPLIAKDEVLGVLIFDLNKPFKEFDQHERSLLETFMDEAGIAVNNAILYEELQDLNERLRNANQRLRDLDQMKDELVSVASHELRTPLTSIKGYLWMALNRQKSNLNPKLEQYLQRSYDSSERLIDLVNDMLSVSRLEGKRVTLEQKPLNLVEFIPSILDDLMPKALEKGLKLTFEKPKEKIPKANADETRLREIMMNLVGNALKFTEKGRVWVTVKAVPAHQEGIDLPMVQVDVHDTGKGIRESDKEKLFTKFGKLQQGSFVKSSEEGGTGLGLYITKRLVELHGGTVWAEGKPGEGTTFSFTIPQA